MRYFIICYGLKGKDMIFGNGQMAVASENYPSYSAIKQRIDDNTKTENSINITNIMELNKEDFESFLI